MMLRAGEWVVLGGSALVAAFAALVGTLIYLKPPPVQYAYREDAHSQRGEAVYRREACGSCHKVHGNGATYGPELDGVGSRRSPAWLHAYLLDPRPGVGVKPYRLRMPSYAALPGPDRDALVAYLAALSSADAAGATGGADVAGAGALAQGAAR